MKNLSHIDTKGNIHMVDVSEKSISNRTAMASGIITLQKNTILKINEDAIAKGNVITTAKIAGIQAAKKTSDLIPLCHSLQIDQIEIDHSEVESGIKVTCKVKSSGKTGVEMEALTGVTIALLTIYDMCKAIDKHMIVTDITLIKKEKI